MGKERRHPFSNRNPMIFAMKHELHNNFSTSTYDSPLPPPLSLLLPHPVNIYRSHNTKAERGKRGRRKNNLNCTLALSATVFHGRVVMPEHYVCANFYKAKIEELVYRECRAALITTPTLDTPTNEHRPSPHSTPNDPARCCIRETTSCNRQKEDCSGPP
ncbi:hypothetical protein C7M84_001499 [Penaeus vannamei]|uniref:Uncharacterized protein n=1 Tax=Penaeus vannamei TaxID=6689 RepID=A0A423TTM2_PENVA|nr:hypothetical protein C7M84_001499 [Penaeus vannamei]